jgi:peptidoglycan/xylan/chitin deacetylase (PgdA/CDA1 family)
MQLPDIYGSLTKPLFFSLARLSGLNWACRRALGRRNLLVLCYHGVVAEDHPDQVFLYRNAISRRQFEHQLEFLNRHFHPISVGELADCLQGTRDLRPHSVLLTFDDGFRNNLTNAAPLLRKFSTPALFSVTTGYIGRADVLWPDEVNLRVLFWPRPTIPYPSSGAGLSKVETQNSGAARIPIAERIRSACKQLSERDRLAYLDLLREVNCPELEQRDRELYDFMTWDEVKALSGLGFEIGSHTVNHPILSRIGAEQLDYELGQSKRSIETHTGRTCACLVYPNGQASDFNSEVERAAERHGYALGFSLTGSYASLQNGRFSLSRIGVPGQQREIMFESCASGVYPWLKRIA